MAFLEFNIVRIACISTGVLKRMVWNLDLRTLPLTKIQPRL